MANLLITIKNVVTGGKDVKQFGESLTELKSGIDLAADAAGQAAEVFRQAWNMSKEGAQLNDLTASFERMNAEVFKTPTLLNDMVAATNSTITQADAMRGILTLSAGATDSAAQAYAAAAPRLLEIAKASNKLNPSLGDTAFLFDSLALGIKRGSPMILDNLGLQIKLGDANAEYARQLGKTVEELTAEEKTMALLNATMAAGDQLITQVGGDVNAQADAWAQLEVKIGETEAAFKQMLANGLLPVVSAASGSYSNAAGQIIDANLAMADSTDALIEQGQKLSTAGDTLGGFGTIVTGTKDEIRRGVEETAAALALQTDSVEEFDAALREAFSGQAQQMLFDYFGELKTGSAGFYELARAAYEAEQAQQAAAEQAALAAENYAAAVIEAESYDLALTNGASAARTWGSALADAYGQAGQAAFDAGQEMYAGIERATSIDPMKLASAFQDAASPVQNLLQAQQDLADSSGEWVTVTYNNASQIADINAQLANDLSNDQRDAYRDILNTVEEGSAEWLSAYNALQGDLSDSTRQGLIAQRAELEGAGDMVANVYTGDAEAAEEARAAIAAAEAAIRDEFRKTAAEAILSRGGINEANLSLLVGIGYLSQEEADARLSFAETQVAIEELTASQEFQALTTEQQAAALNSLIAGQTSTAEAAQRAGEQIQKEGESVEELRIRLVNTAGTYEATVTADTTQAEAALARLKTLMDAVMTSGFATGGQGSMMAAEAAAASNGNRAMGGPVMAGNMYQVGEGNQPEMLVTNSGLFMIPGDNGRVISNSEMQSQPMARGGNTTINIYPPPGASPMAIASMVNQKLAVGG